MSTITEDKTTFTPSLDLVASQEVFVPYLFETLPELKKEYKELQTYWEKPEPPLESVVDDLLQPYMAAMLQQDFPSQLDRIFQVLETMAVSTDYRVRKLLSLGICEVIAYSPAMYRAATPYIRENTLLECDKIREAIQANRTA